MLDLIFFLVGLYINTSKMKKIDILLFTILIIIAIRIITKKEKFKDWKGVDHRLPEPRSVDIPERKYKITNPMWWLNEAVEVVTGKTFDETMDPNNRNQFLKCPDVDVAKTGGEAMTAIIASQVINKMAGGDDEEYSFDDITGNDSEILGSVMDTPGMKDMREFSNAAGGNWSKLGTAATAGQYAIDSYNMGHKAYCLYDFINKKQKSKNKSDVYPEDIPFSINSTGALNGCGSKYMLFPRNTCQPVIDNPFDLDPGGTSIKYNIPSDWGRGSTVYTEWTPDVAFQPECKKMLSALDPSKPVIEHNKSCDSTAECKFPYLCLKSDENSSGGGKCITQEECRNKAQQDGTEPQYLCSQEVPFFFANPGYYPSGKITKKGEIECDDAPHDIGYFKLEFEQGTPEAHYLCGGNAGILNRPGRNVITEGVLTCYPKDHACGDNKPCGNVTLNLPSTGGTINSSQKCITDEKSYNFCRPTPPPQDYTCGPNKKCPSVVMPGTGADPMETAWFMSQKCDINTPYNECNHDKTISANEQVNPEGNYCCHTCTNHPYCKDSWKETGKAANPGVVSIVEPVCKDNKYTYCAADTNVGSNWGKFEPKGRHICGENMSCETGFSSCVSYTGSDGGMCVESNGEVSGATSNRKTPSTCCSAYGQTKGYKWIQYPDYCIDTFGSSQKKKTDGSAVPDITKGGRQASCDASPYCKVNSGWGITSCVPNS